MPLDLFEAHLLSLHLGAGKQMSSSRSVAQECLLLRFGPALPGTQHTSHEHLEAALDDSGDTVKPRVRQALRLCALAVRLIARAIRLIARAIDTYAAPEQDLLEEAAPERLADIDRTTVKRDLRVRGLTPPSGGKRG